MEKIIKEIISKEGPITFARFMELALYHPERGYYTAHSQVIGKDGDFYTSPHVSPVFGEMLADEIAEMAGLIAGKEFKLVEFGAGRGFLALDIIRELQKNFPEVYERTTYYIVEVSPALREKQQRILAELKLPSEKVSWISDINEAGKPFYGCVFSNELVDAFPVHIVKQDAHGLKEIFVGVKDNSFTEIQGAPSTPLLEEYFQRLNVRMEDKQRAEINLAALDWIQSMGNVLDKGFVMTIDYGYPAHLLYHPSRFDGTLMCYYRHGAHADPYVNIGEQDMTSHVNFSALEVWGNDTGLFTSGFTNQMHFLFNLGIAQRIDSHKKAMAVQQLVSPEGMGGIFKILIQHKGLDNPSLKCLKDIG